MLETVSRGFRAAKHRLSGKAEITDQSISEAVRDIRVALLEADVDLKVAKAFVARVKEKALGEVVQVKTKGKKGAMQVSPGDHFIKICHDELEALMGPVEPGLAFASKGPTKVMMVGLQGSGKTTTAAKLARRLKEEGKSVLLVAADIYRPAAVDQLQQLGARLSIPVHHTPDTAPPVLCEQALELAKKQKTDVVIFDTAGRLAIDEPMMAELEAVKSRTRPENILLVCDAMIGQDAVRTAATFDERLDLTGFVMTKLDGDARGGAALSIKDVTGKPIKYLGLGEGLDKLEDFRPEGLASRILGFGDIVGLMQDFETHVDEEEAERDAGKILSGNFDLDDFVKQIQTLQKMGSLSDLLEKFPLFGQLPEGFSIDDRELLRVKAMVGSMTRKERAHPEIIDTSRIKRVAKGSGTKEADVKGLLDRFKGMRDIFKKLGPDGSLGLLGNLPGLKNLAMLKQLKGQEAELAGLFGGPGGPGGSPFGLPQLGGPMAMGPDGPVPTGPMTQAEIDRARRYGWQEQGVPKSMSKSERNKRDKKRKDAKKARKQARKRKR
ncbi:MAG: signal recognition particle protein [Deltaproteobacteria bacterium]|nr:signal recognition particle protein [Deltaproteobacteria bacterium]